MSDHPSAPVIEPGIYRHYKNKRYQVVGVALHSETQEPLVVYKPMYDTEIQFWVRPYEMFVDSVEIDGRLVPRFERTT